ncbi:PEP-CTERM motif-containing protein [Duganella sacchari]|uniref:PEP-CTERM motif-containing protein n=1 Tax=Duganella sacchari TaxID=551987 RepID=A0A1M7P6P0_9BURK|nr:MHFG family PEP-CTERM protein [Duganella sacchari]SHN12273.1 PEP-CTERM motif-containing protein [Duganella sacchari]
MPLLLAVTLAAAIQPNCSWDHPGRNPYTGSTAAAIDRYTDIPAAVRTTLKRRMEEGQSDDKVSITRDHIAGKYQYDTAIRDMHFGKASVCATVTRDKWTESRNEPGAVYCVGEHCILVPRICGNVSRITRTASGTATADRRKPATSGTDEKAAELGAPVTLADLGLIDAPSREDIALDQPDEAMRQANQQHAMDRIAGIFTEEELAEAADASRYGAFGRHHDFDTDDDLLQPAAPVPEADTWAMLLAGLGLLSWQARRRARKTAAAVAE